MNIRKKIVKLLNVTIPKDKKFILFTSNPDFSDNSMAVFEAIRNDEKYADYKLVWITRDSSIREFKGAKCYKVNSIKSFFAYFRAKYVFTTHGLYYGTCSKSQIKVGLWHGMPLKSIGAFSAYSDTHLITDEVCDFTYMIASSPLYREIMSKCFCLNNESIIITGLPRNDELLHQDDSLEKLSICRGNKVICWLPTFRKPVNIAQEHGVFNQGKNYEFGIPFITHENINELNKCLGDEGVTLIIKIHGIQKFNKSSFPEVSNIFIVTNNDLYANNVQLYNLLACSNALITDYSSVYIDYLATDKPIAFIVDDIEEYEHDRGFVFENPMDYMPGMKIKTLDNLIDFIRDVRLDRDDFKKERLLARESLNIFADDKNTKRVIDFVFEKKR